MFAGIDIGTGSLKAVLSLSSGIHTITEQYRSEMFNGGYHIVPHFQQSVLTFFRKISDFSRKMNERIEGIGLCGHGPSILVIDKDGNPLTEIQTWQDSSAFQEAEEIKTFINRFTKDGTSFEAKLYKLFKDRRNLFSGSVTVLYPKDYVIFLLTGRMVLDFPTASTLAFFNPDSRVFNTYSTGIPTDVFPEVVESWEEAGKTGTHFSRNSSLNDGIPVIAGGIDAWCEALGAGALDDGMLVDGSGTSTCITCCRKEADSGFRHVIPGKFLKIETMSSTGASLAWIMDIFSENLDEIKKINKFIPVPVIYLPYLNGERSPVWDERASASFTGIISENGREDLIKSVLQGIAFGTRQCIKLAGKGNGYSVSSIRAVGGGANNKAMLQYKADISGITYISMEETDAAPLGAMLLASFGCKKGSLKELTERWVKTGFKIVPDETYREIWDQLFLIYSDLFNRLKDSAHSLFEIRNNLKTYKY